VKNFSNSILCAPPRQTQVPHGRGGFFLVFFLTAAPVMDVRRESPHAIVVAALDDRIHRCQ